MKLSINHNFKPSVGLGLSTLRGFGDGSAAPGDPILAAMLAESPIIAYDNNDLTAFYTNQSGGAQATINGVVGLQLDKSQGGRQTLPVSGWTKLDGDGVVTVDGGVITITGATTITRVDISAPGWSVNDYVDITIDSSVAGATSPLIYVGAAPQVLTSGEKTYTAFLAASTVLRLQINAGSATFTVSSRGRTPGYHRYQATTASKPILRGTPTGSTLVSNGDFSGGTAGWSAALNSTISISSGALRVTATAATNLAEQAITTSAGRVYRVRARYVGGTATTPIFRVGSTTIANNLLNVSGVSGTIERYFTAAGGTSYINFGSSGATAGQYTDWDDIEVLDVSADAVSTPYFLHYDGVDDFMLTASVDMTATDEMTVCIGARKLSDAAVGQPVGFGNVDTQNGSVQMRIPYNAGPSAMHISRGTAARLAFLSDATLAAPLTGVWSGLSKISTDTILLRKDGNQIASGTVDQGTGNYSAFPWYFGRGPTGSGPFNGYDYGPCIFPALKSGAGLDAIEAFAADRTGVTL